MHAGPQLRNYNRLEGVWRRHTPRHTKTLSIQIIIGAGTVAETKLNAEVCVEENSI